MGKVIIVEGKTDKQRLEQLLDEPAEIVCTHGTIAEDKLEELLAWYSGEEIYVLLDADYSGDKVRRLFKRDYPGVHHLYTQRKYREVAVTPWSVLAQILEDAHFVIKLPEEFENE